MELRSSKWKSNRVVTLVSIFAGQMQVTKSIKSTKEISYPFLKKEYNHHIGGVDLLDANLARHKIVLKSKKWYIGVYYGHGCIKILDFIQVNL